MQQSMTAEVWHAPDENQEAKGLTLLGAPASVGVAKGVNPSEATKGGCAQAWQQCRGGPGWVGPVCCQDGCTCQSSPDGFGHCKPSEGRISCASSGNADFLVQRFEGEKKPRHHVFDVILSWRRLAALGTAILTALTVCGLFVCVAVRVGHHYMSAQDEGWDEGRRQDAEISKRVLMVRTKIQPCSYEAMSGNPEAHSL